jgi:CelD/BcsL family acetyltransferase involved in cellulose biosynthesis
VAEAELIVELAGLEALAAEWDALAVANGEPTAAPAWMLAWWRQLAPPGAALRVVAVRARGELIGVVPLYAAAGRRGASRRHRLLAAGFSASVTPLALPDRVWEVAEAAGALLSACTPRPDAIELAPTSASSPWPLALRERWPGRMRPLALRRNLLPAPTLTLRHPSFEAWLASRSSRFRANVRRYRRLFEEEGGTYRRATRETVAADIATFAGLHAARWVQRGASRLVAQGERLPAFLAELADGLLEQERFRLLLLELDGQPICADLWIAAGGEVTGVNIGWDERFKRLSAPRLAFLHTLEDAFARGERRLNLGWGRVDYKQGYANGGDMVAWDALLIPGAGLARTLPRALPLAASRRARQSAKRLLSQRHADRLSELRGALRRRRSA